MTYPTPHNPAPLVRLQGATKTYQVGETRIEALRGVDLSVPRGQFVAVTGRSGSGKSTLLNIIGCLDRPSSGSYEFDGRAVHRLNDRELSDVRNRRVGFVFQAFNLLDDTAWENVRLPLIYRNGRDAVPEGRIGEVLRRVGLGDRMRHRPDQLSGGEQQRTAIARAIVGKPSLICADEPTGNLDTKTGDGIVDLLFELCAEGAAVVLVTHNEALARRTARRIVLEDGRIVEDALA